MKIKYLLNRKKLIKEMKRNLNKEIDLTNENVKNLKT